MNQILDCIFIFNLKGPRGTYQTSFILDISTCENYIPQSLWKLIWHISGLTHTCMCTHTHTHTNHTHKDILECERWKEWRWFASFNSLFPFLFDIFYLGCIFIVCHISFSNLLALCSTCTAILNRCTGFFFFFLLKW